MGQKLDNGVLPAFVAEAEGQPDGSQRQVIKVAEMPAVSVTGGATEAKQDSIITELQAIQAAQLPDSHNVTVDNASLPITAASLPLPAGAATAALQAPPSGIGQGSASVVTPSTAVVLGSATAIKKVLLHASDSNTVNVSVGGSGVTPTSGAYLFPGAQLTLEIDNLNKVYINATATATVRYTYLS